MARVAGNPLTTPVLMDVDLSKLINAPIIRASASSITYNLGVGREAIISGTLGYDGAGRLIGGLIINYQEVQSGSAVLTVTQIFTTVPQFLGWLASEPKIAFGRLLAGGDTVEGTWLDDDLRGFEGRDVLNGSRGTDRLDGGAGDDQLTGGEGDDLLIGGDGVDTAQFQGPFVAYRITAEAGSWIVTDLRSGSPDGTDTLHGVEILSFADRTVDLRNFGTTPTLPHVATAVGSILRSPNPVMETDLSAKISVGTMTVAQAVTDIVKAADQTTSVATLSYQFFTGRIPGAAGIDYLVSPTGGNANNLNSAYFQSFNLENRYINFAVNLGRDGEGKAAFQADYGSLSFFEATKKAYGKIFGAAPPDDRVSGILSDGREAYFAAYGGDGPEGLGTKAAMVGWLLAEAEKSDRGTMARSNGAWLTDLADGAAPYGIDILAANAGYNKAEYVWI